MVVAGSCEFNIGSTTDFRYKILHFQLKFNFRGSAKFNFEFLSFDKPVTFNNGSTGSFNFSQLHEGYIKLYTLGIFYSVKVDLQVSSINFHFYFAGKWLVSDSPYTLNSPRNQGNILNTIGFNSAKGFFYDNCFCEFTIRILSE